MPGQALPAAGPYRFGRPLEACEPALESEKAPEHRVSLGWNERNFLSLEQKERLIHCLFEVSAADKSISLVEENEVRRIAEELQLDHREFSVIRSQYNTKRSILKGDAPQE